MLHYILQTVAFQLFFLIIYDVFLKKETFFNWNRFYLLVTAIAAVVLPFIKLESIRTFVPEQFVIRLPEVIIGDVETVSNNAATTIGITSQTITDSGFIWSWDYLLYAGMILATLIFIYKIIKISVLIQKNPKRWKDNLIIIKLLKSNAAFSFFNYVFLGEWIKEEEKEIILKHELVHVHQNHSLDLILFEVFRILFWYNPLIYMYQNRITELHEYIADAKAMKQTNKKQYYEKLLSQVFDTENISFTNTFFTQSLIKKRIVMLSKSKSNQIHLSKYPLLIPMVFGMLMYTSSYGQDNKQFENPQEEKVNQKLTDDELKKKLYNEIIEMDENGEGFKQISDFTMPDREQYLSSRTDYYRFVMYAEYLFEKSIERKMKAGSLEPDDVDRAEKMKEKVKTFDEYLEWKKTDEAKAIWENNTRDGLLRMVVNDMKNLTDEEKKKQDQKINLIQKDEFFHSLLITDGKSSSTLEFHSKEGKKIQNQDNKSEIEITEDSLEIPFSVIDEVPTTEACKSFATNDEKRQCLANSIADFVNKNFNTNLAKELNLKGKQRISVLFKIGKDGNIKEVLARAPHPGLEEEAKRIIKLLPQMIPGKHNGKAVVVPYSLPILFQVQDDAKTAVSDNEVISELKKGEDIEFPFSMVEIPPTFKSCLQNSDSVDLKNCTEKTISDFINKNFNINLATEIGIKGKQKISVLFKIGKDGTIYGVKARAAHPELEKEAIRIIEAMPQMIPGKHKGENVVVPYSLPILFEISE